MDFSVYVNKVVKIDISNGFFFEGHILSVDNDFLTIEDRKKRLVTIAIHDILNIREVGK